MRIVNVAGRLAIELSNGIVDVDEASGGRFGPDVQSVYDQWSDFAAWAGEQTEVTGPLPAPADLGAPVPRPRQVFAIGLNYRAHADESNIEYPESPLVFTKFASSIAGPVGDLVLSGERVDWEVEIVAVIGTGGTNISEADAWSHVAGLTVGQDYSDRKVQLTGRPPQFSMGKSFAGFSPMGPALVTLDEFDDVDDIALTCEIDGETVQSGRSSGLIFTVSELIAWLSNICELFPGDVIFTGTPEGVGAARKPPRFLQPGEVVVSTVEGIGSIEQRCVAS